MKRFHPKFTQREGNDMAQDIGLQYILEGTIEKPASDPAAVT